MLISCEYCQYTVQAHERGSYNDFNLILMCACKLYVDWVNSASVLVSCFNWFMKNISNYLEMCSTTTTTTTTYYTVSVMVVWSVKR